MVGYSPLDPIFISNLHIYHVFDEDFIRKVMIMYTEGGLFVNLMNSLKQNALTYFRRENRVYFTVKEYIDDVVTFDNLVIDNFYNIFKLYFSFCSTVLLGFVIHVIIDFIYCLKMGNRRRKRRIKRKRRQIFLK